MIESSCAHKWYLDEGSASLPGSLKETMESMQARR